MLHWPGLGAFVTPLGKLEALCCVSARWIKGTSLRLSACSVSGGAAVILKENSGQVICLQLPMDGNPIELTSYWTELSTILGEFILLWKLIPLPLQQKLTEILWTDSESSMEKVISTIVDFPKSNKEVLSKKFSIIVEMHSLQRLFPNIKIKWLEIHQNISSEE